MSSIGSFNTVRLTFEEGYLVSDIRIGDPAGFQRFLAMLEAAGQSPVQVYALRSVPGEVWYELFDQLDEPPVNNGIKQLDLGGNADIVRNFIEPRDGFREQWIVDGQEGGLVRGSQLDDVVFADGGADLVKARVGDDYVAGAFGNDTLYGLQGDDILNGEGNRDVLDGGDGNDILRGGVGGDAATGGDGADTFLFTRDDFAGRRLTDVILDYDARAGDQIVDESHDLRVVDTGFVEAVRDDGTLLENRRTGHRVFVKDAELTQGDIKRSYTAPDPDDDGPQTPGDGDGDPGTPSGNGIVFRGPDSGEAYTIRVQRSAAFFDGQDNVENYDIFIRNNTGTAIENLDDLKVTFPGAADLGIVSASGATYSDGVFDVAGSSVGAFGETRIFGFQVENRPAGIPLDDRTVDVLDFTPRGPGGRPIGTGTGFELTVETIDPFAGGASAEVYIRNVGGRQLVDLDGLEFRFDDDVRKITDIWGADAFDGKFGVSPWGPGNPHGPLQAGEKVKLFGFTFEVGNRNPLDVVKADDFSLTSRFNDLLS